MKKIILITALLSLTIAPLHAQAALVFSARNVIKNLAFSVGVVGLALTATVGGAKIAGLTHLSFSNAYKFLLTNSKVLTTGEILVIYSLKTLYDFASYQLLFATIDLRPHLKLKAILDNRHQARIAAAQHDELRMQAIRRDKYQNFTTNSRICELMEKTGPIIAREAKARQQAWQARLSE